nr:hypothetical protein [uncultured Flavobacterium sp.]
MKFRHREETKEFTHRHLGDVMRMVNVCGANGIETDLETCAWLWSDYSEQFAAGWLDLGDDDAALFDTLFRHAVYNNDRKGIDV